MGWDLLHGSRRLHFPKASTQSDRSEEKNLNQSWLHNLNAEVIISPPCWIVGLLDVWIVWVVCLESEEGIPMPIVRWMAHGNAHHGKWPAENKRPAKKERKKEVNCGLLTENESVCRKDKEPLPRPSGKASL